MAHSNLHGVGGWQSLRERCIELGDELGETRLVGLRAGSSLHAQLGVPSVNDVRELLEAHAHEEGCRHPVSLCHQATYVGHAYVTLVWLRECVGKKLEEDEKKKFYQEFSDRFKVTSAKARIEKHLDGAIGPDLSKADRFLQTVRNALAHAHVAVSDDCWHLTNTCTRNNKKQWTAHIELDWQQFGSLCDASLFAYQTQIYPESAAPPIHTV